jgi:hypothetical protein
MASGVTPILETNLCQDDYQQVMNRTHHSTDNSLLLGFQELNLAHPWPDSWFGISIDRLLSWLSCTKEITVLPSADVAVVDVDTLSIKQCQAFNLIAEHIFDPDCDRQLLMIVLGTASTGKLLKT